MCVTAEMPDGRVIERLGDMIAELGESYIVIEDGYSLEAIGAPNACLCPVNFQETARLNGFTLEQSDSIDPDCVRFAV